MSNIRLIANRKYPSIPTVGGDATSHTMALEAIRDAIQTHERRGRDPLNSFLRLYELIDLGLVRREGDKLVLTFDPTAMGGGGGGSGVVETVVDGAGIGVDSTDPANPVVSNEGVITLTPGDGSISIDDTDPQNLVITAPAGSSGSLLFVGEVAVSGAAATTLVMSSLDLDADEAYFISLEMGRAGAGASNISMYFNADTTATNYNNQQQTTAGTGIFAAGGNAAIIAGVNAGNTMSVKGWLRRNAAGCPCFVHEGVRTTSTTLDSLNGALMWRTAATNVTGITISASVASSLAIGTTLRVWKLLT